MKYDNWFQKYPHLLEHAYRISALFFKLIHPLIKKIGYQRVDSWLNRPERWAKEVVFGCKMCGQCILQSTGMTCSMNCPKNLRNGPCGGVRSNGHCEDRYDQIKQQSLCEIMFQACIYLMQRRSTCH